MICGGFHKAADTHDVRAQIQRVVDAVTGIKADVCRKRNRDEFISKADLFVFCVLQELAVVDGHDADRNVSIAHRGKVFIRPVLDDDDADRADLLGVECLFGKAQDAAVHQRELSGQILAFKIRKVTEPAVFIFI